MKLQHVRGGAKRLRVIACFGCTGYGELMSRARVGAEFVPPSGFELCFVLGALR